MNDSRQYPARPICGVGAVVRNSDSVLLIQRGREPRRGEWTVPGGAVELGESLREAVRREIREECGIEITVGEVLEAFDLLDRDEAGRLKYHYIIIDFAASYAGGQLSAGDDVLDARWVAVADLDSYELTQKTREEILKVLNRS